MTLSDYLKQQQKIIDQALDRLVPAESTPPQTIHRAMRYSLFAGGKRIRPVLAIEAARVVSEEAEGSVDAACPLELIHTYSLIHDDLPALDNDDFRRGRLTCHKVFGRCNGDSGRRCTADPGVSGARGAAAGGLRPKNLARP